MEDEILPGIAGEFVELRVPNGDLVVGRFEPRDGCVIAITIPTAAIPSLQAGDRIEIGSLPPLERLRLRGAVEKVDRLGARSIVFVNACTEIFHWHPHFMERRRAVRVRPSLLEPLRVAFKQGETLLRGRVRDLSVEGVAIVIASASRKSVAVPSEIPLLLRFPRSSQDLLLRTHLLRALEEDHALVLSGCFDARSLQFATQQQALQRYVVSRQGQLASRDAASKETAATS